MQRALKMPGLLPMPNGVCSDPTTFRVMDYTLARAGESQASEVKVSDVEKE